MAVFNSASDESAGKDRQDRFVFAGLIASEPDWSEIFAPAWQKLVLDGPPAIPYLHMTEMRRRQWRAEQGLSQEDAEKRIDEAIALMEAAAFLFPIGIEVSGADVRDAFATVKIRAEGRTPSSFEPDYLCFLGYAMVTLDYVSRHHKDCEKLNFVVENNGKTTAFIKKFHDGLGGVFESLGRPELAKLMGELSPVSKEHIPVQAADILCWHTARSKTPDAMEDATYRRYEKLARKKGCLQSLDRDTVLQLAKLLVRQDQLG